MSRRWRLCRHQPVAGSYSPLISAWGLGPRLDPDSRLDPVRKAHRITPKREIWGGGCVALLFLAERCCVSLHVLRESSARPLNSSTGVCQSRVVLSGFLPFIPILENLWNGPEALIPPACRQCVFLSFLSYAHCPTEKSVFSFFLCWYWLHDGTLFLRGLRAAEFPSPP